MLKKLKENLPWGLLIAWAVVLVGSILFKNSDLALICFIGVISCFLAGVIACIVQAKQNRELSEYKKIRILAQLIKLNLELKDNPINPED